MTVTVSKSALNLREELARAKARVSDRPQRFDFANLVTNGTFDSDISGWVADGAPGAEGVTFSWNASGYMDLARGTSGEEGAPQTSFNVGNATRVLFSYENLEISRLTSSVALSTSANPDIQDNDGGGVLTYAFTVIPGETATVRFWPGQSSTAQADNVYAYEADPSDDAPIYRLPTGWKVVDSGMIVRDGSIFHHDDYEEIQIGGDWCIKPAVAPGPNTEVSIWAYREDI